MTLRTLIFYAILRPLIFANYWLRQRHILADKWFWADVLAVKWGFIRKIWEPRI